MHLDRVGESFAVEVHWVRLLSLGICHHFMRLEVKPHWNGSSLNIVRSPAEHHIWLPAELLINEVQRRIGCQNILEVCRVLLQRGIAHLLLSCVVESFKNILFTKPETYKSFWRALHRCKVSSVTACTRRDW